MKHVKHRAVLVFFIIFTAALIAFFIIYRNSGSEFNVPIQSQMVSPSVDSERFGLMQNDSLSDIEENMTSFIPLQSNETLVGILTLDFDNDTRDDQINLIKKVTSPYLYLLVGLYNPENGIYERSAELETSITQVHTFSYACLDVLGNHQLSLVYQGFTDDGNAVLQIYNLQKDKKNNSSLQLIGDFKSDGSIFIQQQQRDQAYELSQVNGEPFPVIVYGSETTDGNMVQYQTRYTWNSKENQFEQTSRSRISESRITANELAKIQDGTVKTFANFLDGLWYKTSSGSDGIRYMFFDYDSSEVILQYNDSEEVYSWLESHLSNTGIYLTTQNETISNLHRRYYITLIATDEVKLRVQEDLGMTINESNLWDGNYKKLSPKSSLASVDKVITSADYIKDFTSGEIWYAADGTRFSFSDGNYAVSGDLISDTGKYAPIDISSSAFITFRSKNTVPFLKSAYKLSYGMITPPAKGTGRNRVQPPDVIDHNTIILQAVTLSVGNILVLDEPEMILTRGASSTAATSIKK